MNRLLSYLLLILSGFLLILTPILGSAQDRDSAGPMYLDFRIQTLKPGQTPQWEFLRKEMRDAAQRSGYRFYHVYQRLRGPQDGFIIVTPAAPIGQPAGPIDGPPALQISQSWYNAISATLDTQMLITVESDSGLRTISDGPLHPTEEFAHVRIRSAAPGRRNDFENWIRNELIPELRRADVGDVRIGHVVLGESPRTWVTFSFVEGWPYALVEDNPVDQRMLNRGDSLAGSWIEYFYRFREDLSFTANE